MNYRMGRHHVNLKQMVLKVADTPAEAQKVIGKIVVFKTETGNEIKGTISGLHGRKGNVKAIFADKGLPGQALGQKVQIV